MLPIQLEHKVAYYKNKYNEILYIVCNSLDAESDLHVICKPLSMAAATYHSEVLTRSIENAHEYIVNSSVLEIYSTTERSFINATDLPLGTYEGIYNSIIENSGYGSPDTLVDYLNYYRSIINQAHIQAIAFICKAFPSYTPHDIDNMSIDELARNISLAELIHEVEFSLVSEGDAANSKEQEEHKAMNSIRKEARMNDKIHTMGMRPKHINFAQENANLNKVVS